MQFEYLDVTKLIYFEVLFFAINNIVNQYCSCAFQFDILLKVSFVC